MTIGRGGEKEMDRQLEPVGTGTHPLAVRPSGSKIIQGNIANLAIVRRQGIRMHVKR